MSKERQFVAGPRLVYFAHVPDIQVIKIGCSSDVDARLDAIQTCNAHEVVLLGTLPGGAKEERRLHAAFVQFRMRGEWFRAGDELLAAVSQLLASGGRRRTVADELRRRNDCRYGLHGVRVYLAGSGDQPFVIAASGWNQDGVLELDLLPLGSPALTAPPSWEPIPVSQLVAPTDMIAAVPAADCILAGRWPIVCPCWLPETKS